LNSCLGLSPECRFIFSLCSKIEDNAEIGIKKLWISGDFRTGSILYIFKYVNLRLKYSINKSTIMGNLLYVIAVILVIAWAIGFLGYHAGGVIHILLVIAIVAVLLKVIRGSAD
jgi:hypothetical protein